MIIKQTFTKRTQNNVYTSSYQTQLLFFSFTIAMLVLVRCRHVTYVASSICDIFDFLLFFQTICASNIFRLKKYLRKVMASSFFKVIMM